MKKIKILFFTNELSRTGAPLFLYNLIKELKTLNYNITVVSKRSGILLDGFLENANTYVLHQNRDTRNKSFLLKLFGFLWNLPVIKKTHDGIILTTLKLRGFQIIYANTVECGSFLKIFKQKNVLKIFHLHEGKRFIDFFDKKGLIDGCNEASYIFACSQYVEETIQLHTNAGNIKIVHTPFNIDKKYTQIKGLSFYDRNTKFKLGSCGSLGWVKGSDLLIPLVKELIRMGLDFEYYWIGINPNSQEFLNLKEEVQKNKLGEYIKLIPQTTNPFSYFQDLTAFILLSRDEAFPTVVLENAAMGNIIFGFQDSGGVEEILKNHPDFLSPYLDVKMLAQTICKHLKNPLAFNTETLSLQKEVQFNYNAPKIYREIESLFIKNLAI